MRRKKGKKDRTHSTLDEHKRDGSKLIPPLATIPNLRHSSWVANRLPELLWCALLVTHLGQERALRLLRRGIVASKPLLTDRTEPLDLGLSGLVVLGPDARGELLGPAIADPDANNLLRTLLLFPELPGRVHWEALLDPPSEMHWNILALAIARTLDHQSQESTDCRWAKVAFRAVNGGIIFPADATDMAREILEYPNYGDQRKVRPTIRSMEIAFEGIPTSGASAWPALFWDRCWKSTPCRRASLLGQNDIGTGTTVNRVKQVLELLQAHQKATTTGTALDPRHDAVFGLVGYALCLLGELLQMGNSTSILARTGLRSILEAFVTLSYLSTKNQEELWAGYRSYGAGQAKLAFLKLDVTEGLNAGFVNADLLDLIANEDQSLEFLTVVLGHWDETNLRQMSENAGTKAEYDQYYPWTSAFVHGNWAALRATVFDVCVNPLHKAHRLLRTGSAPLGDVVADAATLIDRMLGLLHSIYPTFPERLRPATAD